jgi:hypothetical protein
MNSDSLKHVKGNFSGKESMIEHRMKSYDGQMNTKSPILWEMFVLWSVTEGKFLPIRLGNNRFNSLRATS